MAPGIPRHRDRHERLATAHQQRLMTQSALSSIRCSTERTAATAARGRRETAPPVPDASETLPSLPHPVLAEGTKAWQGLAILLPVCGGLARDNIVDVADRKPFDLHAPAPGVTKALDTVRSKDKVEVKGTVLELDEILPAFDFRGLVLAEREPEFAQSRYQCRAILRGFFDKKVRVLRGVGEAQENGAGFAQKEVAHTVPLEAFSYFLRLPVFKRGHSPASLAGSPHTSAGNQPSCRRPGTARRP